MSQDQSNVLIVDDERSIRISLRTILSGLGFGIVEAARGEEALSLVRTAQFDAVLLDINMPGIGGIEVCRLMRKVSPGLPIVMLTVQGSEDRKVEASGCRRRRLHYEAVPAARTDCAHPRGSQAQQESRRKRAQSLRSETFVWILTRHTVQKKGRTVHLTPKQFELLHFLMANAGKPVPHGKLLRSVWGPEYGNELEYLRTFVRQVRMKIEDDPANPRYLLTESHIGYRFSESV